MTTSPAERDPQALTGRRAPVNGPPGGTIAWSEHLLAWESYAQRHSGQDAQRIAERGGFGLVELVTQLGYLPETWVPSPRMRWYPGAAQRAADRLSARPAATPGERRAEVDRVARLLMAEWERVEEKPVGISFVATFVDMARAVIADRPAATTDTAAQAELLAAQVADEREGRKIAGESADRFRDVLSECLGHPDENPGDDALVSELREHFGKTGPEPRRWRDFLTGALAQLDQINAMPDPGTRTANHDTGHHGEGA